MLRLLCTLCLVITLQSKLAPQEREALVDLFHSAGGSGWKSHHNWLRGDPCENRWHGVKCSQMGRYQHVTELSLADNNLDGTLPPSFGNMTKMSILALDIFNQLRGPLPENIGQMRDVILFTIAGSGPGTPGDKFSGPIPKGICQLTSMSIMHFGDNAFTSIPECFCNHVPANCALGGNNFKCPIPDCAKTKCGATCT
eukprot:TRINITY_DN54681_c0_g1_i1.p2 TRINITY_DN54681_c0_g1~~TRINITY_DN54681_c0_g1_i1.p2  ORF type:complete len:198 (-),score=7.03 TRINITY_DN54681_c0_g1_i1:362-955(-)